MEPKKNCPNCNKPLDTRALQGLCPDCLLKAGWLTASQADPVEGGFIPPSPETLARLFPKLEILELIGRGGMGAVFKARQPKLDRLVALKILPQKKESDPGFAARFTREAQALAKLNHRNIVAVHDYGQVEGFHYFIMEYVDGLNLRQVQQAGTLSATEALGIIPKICEALQYAHDEGVVHRDIKPENVLLDQKGQIKIADFGLAKILGTGRANFTLTEPNHVMGTPHYMAPEQVEHPSEVDHRADIYSLGVVFYELLTGELPLGKFAAPSHKVQVDVRLDSVVLRALEKEPQLRYQQAQEIRTEVETIAHTPGQKPPPTSADDSAQLSPMAQLKGPAIGLIVTGVLEWVLVPLIILAMLAIGGFIPGPIEIAVMLSTLPIASFLIFAGLRIKRAESYAAGICAAILAMLVTPANLVGLCVGVWTLVVLNRKNVQDAFRSKAQTKRDRPVRAQAGWSMLIHAGCLILAGVVLLYVMPKFIANFNERELPLTTVTQSAVTLVAFLQQYGLTVFATLLLLDAVILLLLSAFAGRRACRVWSAIVVSVMILMTGMVSAAIVLIPVRQVTIRDVNALATAELLPVPNDQATEAQYPFVARLPRGTIELVGICNHPSVGKAWWAPDGAPAQEGPFRTRVRSLQVGEGQQAWEFVIRTGNLPEGVSFGSWKLTSSKGGSGGTVVSRDDSDIPGLRVISTKLPVTAQKTDLSMEVGVDEWLTLDRHTGSSSLQGLTRNGQSWTFAFAQPVQAGPDIRVTIAYTAKPDWQVRTVATTNSGEEIHGPQKLTLTEDMAQSTTTFSNLSLADIKDFAFQVRPYHSVTFENVSLVPGQETVVKIRHAVQ